MKECAFLYYKPMYENRFWSKNTLCLVKTAFCVPHFQGDVRKQQIANNFPPDSQMNKKLKDEMYSYFECQMLLPKLWSICGKSSFYVYVN